MSLFKRIFNRMRNNQKLCLQKLKSAKSGPLRYKEEDLVGYRSWKDFSASIGH